MIPPDPEPVELASELTGIEMMGGVFKWNSGSLYVFDFNCTFDFDFDFDFDFELELEETRVYIASQSSILMVLQDDRYQE